MTEETPQQAAVEPVVVPPTETEAPAPATETTETQPVQGEPEKPAEPEKAAEPEKPKSRAQQRIEELSADKKAAEKRAEQAEARLKAIEAKQAPNPDTYEDPAKYHADLTTYAVQQARAVELRDEASEAATRANAARDEAWMLKVGAVADRFPDFDAVTRNPQLPVSQTMADVISEHENGPALLYYLGKNPEEARRIYHLSPARVGLEIGRIEAKVSLPPPKKISTAPAPVPALAGGGGVASQKSLEDMSYEEYRASRGF